MKLYNSLSREVETLKPLDPPVVKIYSCGPTVYDNLHVGNWSAYIYWDVLVRTLLLGDYQVDRIINITDVGHLVSDADDGQDKLDKAAKREHVTAWEIAQKYTTVFLADFKKLQLIEPRQFARATDFINQQLEIVHKLKELGLTYQIQDGIYIDTSKVADYGKLARLNIKNLQAGARVEFNSQKRNITDFAVWKFSGTDKRDMEWPTPDNVLDQPSDQPLMGFPGWHLECSAIIYSLLGDQIDIHTGGIDHIPVHHTNELAQMEPITHKQLAQIWLHNNHLKVDGTKISKSLGNGYTLGDIENKGFTPMDLKMLVLQSHYQTEGNFSFENLEAAHNRLNTWLRMACLRNQIFDQQPLDAADDYSFLAVKHHIFELANDNLKTPQILAAIDNEFLKIDNLLKDGIELDRRSLIELIEVVDKLLGFDLMDGSKDIPDKYKKLIQERKYARVAKDFKKSDSLRNLLSQAGILLDDRSRDSYWYYQS